MNDKVGRNDPCPCGSGKKYKQCCITKAAGPKKKFTAKLLSGKKEEQSQAGGINLMDRAFGGAVEAANRDEKPPLPKISLPGQK
jgi:uncharacterized protein